MFSVSCFMRFTPPTSKDIKLRKLAKIIQIAFILSIISKLLLCTQWYREVHCLKVLKYFKTQNQISPGSGC